MLGPAVVYAGVVVRVKGGAAVRAAVGPATVIAGIATFVAYALVLAALAARVGRVGRRGARDERRHRGSARGCRC